MHRSLLICAAFAFAGSAFGTSIVYSNILNDTFDTQSYTAGPGSPYTELGDQIQLGGTDRFGNQATVQFFNAGAAGTFDAILRLFALGSPVGSQIGSDFLVSGVVTTGGDSINVVFNLGFLLLPDDLIFTVEAAAATAGVDLGLNLFEPPGPGSSDPTYMIARPSGGYVQLGMANPPEDVYFLLTADATSSVPEPATISAVGLGLLGLVWLRKRLSSN